MEGMHDHNHGGASASSESLDQATALTNIDLFRGFLAHMTAGAVMISVGLVFVNIFIDELWGNGNLAYNTLPDDGSNEQDIEKRSNTQLEEASSMTTSRVIRKKKLVGIVALIGICIGIGIEGGSGLLFHPSHNFFFQLTHMTGYAVFIPFAYFVGTEHNLEYKPSNILFGMGSLCQYLMMISHAEHKHDPIEGQGHYFLALSELSTAVSFFALGFFQMRESNIYARGLKLLSAFVTVFQGSWLWNMAFVTFGFGYTSATMAFPTVACLFSLQLAFASFVYLVYVNRKYNTLGQKRVSHGIP